MTSANIPVKLLTFVCLLGGWVNGPIQTGEQTAQELVSCCKLKFISCIENGAWVENDKLLFLI